MENTGTWDSDLVNMWFLAFLLPIAIGFAITVIVRIAFLFGWRPATEPTQEALSKKEKTDLLGETLMPIATYLFPHLAEPAITEEGTVVEEVAVPYQMSREEAWEQVVAAAVQKAAQGDKGARDWLTKHVFQESPTRTQSQNNNRQSQNNNTQSQMVTEVISSLSSLGYDKKTLKSTIERLLSQREYTNTEQLLEDVVKNC